MPNAQRGEVWQVGLGLVAKIRPALILSVPFEETDRAVYAVVPHTTAIRGSQFEVKLQVRGLEPGAFDIQGLRNVPGSVLMRKLGVLTGAQTADIEKVAKRWLALP